MSKGIANLPAREYHRAHFITHPNLSESCKTRDPVAEQVRAFGFPADAPRHELADGRIVVSLCAHVRAVIDGPAFTLRFGRETGGAQW